MQKTSHKRASENNGLHLIVMCSAFFTLLSMAHGELDKSNPVAGIEDVYTAKGELELYTGIHFPCSASNFHCHVSPSNKLTVIARFDIPSEDMIALAKYSPKIPMLNDSSLGSDFELSSLLEPYQGQAWFLHLAESDFLLSGQCHAKDRKESWNSKAFASFVNDQILRVYLIYRDSNNIPPSKEMIFYAGIPMPDSADNFQLIKKKVGLYEKTLHTSIRFDLSVQDGHGYMERIKSHFHFEERHDSPENVKVLLEKLFKFNSDIPAVDPSKKVYIGKPSPSIRFDVIIAVAVLGNERMCFYFEFYESIGVRNKIETVGEFLGVRLSSHVENIQYHVMWRGDGRMVRFDIPKSELKDFLIQLEGDATLSVLKKGDKLKDRIVENHGIAWWDPGQMNDMKWCIKNDGMLFVAAGTTEGKDCATVFVKYVDTGF